MVWGTSCSQRRSHSGLYHSNFTFCTCIGLRFVTRRHCVVQVTVPAPFLKFSTRKLFCPVLNGSSRPGAALHGPWSRPVLPQPPHQKPREISKALRRSGSSQVELSYLSDILSTSVHLLLLNFHFRKLFIRLLVQLPFLLMGVLINLLNIDVIIFISHHSGLITKLHQPFW